ncbi:NAD-dependent epimerase/dehydratase family protein [Pedobacter sp. ISL-64]|uniref:NAD-dependent epimerase/dehydratase family protein n=1 Tax=Pedobacter sp. ISL-64 TaxID=2819164 RepID=UPI001BE8C950|nr:SDR family oxidoreductase [Pedobacter sp. ISL-64]MBT2562758.1 SDR family oxidoreductase [Pedobacter sp. ISL-64]
MSKISILGANGYIGQHLAYNLLENHEHDIALFDVQARGKIKNELYEQLDLSSDISNNATKKLCDSDYIYFFSGLTGTYKSVEEYQNFININELGLLKVLDLIKDQITKPKIIFPSTRLIYKGKKGILLKEDDEKEFKTIYSINKFACESYLEIYRNLFGLDYTIFRICVPYGNMIGTELSYGTLGHFVNKAQNGQPISLYGDGNLCRTFTHVEDLTNILIIGGMVSDTNNKVYNIGGKDHLSLLDVATPIADFFNVTVNFIPFPEVDMLIESGDTMFDDSALMATIKYSYIHSFNDWMGTLK